MDSHTDTFTITSGSSLNGTSVAFPDTICRLHNGALSASALMGAS
jgi:hypothetical protein